MTTSSDPSKFPGNITTVSNDSITDGAGSTTRFIMLNPNKRTNILVKTNDAGTVIVSTAIAVQLADGTSLTNGTKITSSILDDASILFSEVFNAATGDYLAGDTRGLSILKIVGDPSGDDVEWAVTEVTD